MWTDPVIYLRTAAQMQRRNKIEKWVDRIIWALIIIGGLFLAWQLARWGLK